MDSVAAPTLAPAVIERRRLYFQDVIRGAAMIHLNHLVRAIESLDGVCEIEEGSHKTNTLRTSHSSTDFGDKAEDDSASRRGTGGALGWP